MNASPSLAIDVPLKALIWEDAGGKVQVSYTTPQVLAKSARFSARALRGSGCFIVEGYRMRSDALTHTN